MSGYFMAVKSAIAKAVATLSASLAGSAGAEMVGFKQSGVGAVQRTVQDKMRDVVSVIDFGADPTGSEDSYPAFAAAIAKISGSGGSIFMPAGIYRLNTGLVFPSDVYIRFYGEGAFRTQMRFYGSGNAITASSNTSNSIHVNMEGFFLWNFSSTATNGIFLKNCQYQSDLVDVFVDGFNKTGTQTVDGYTFYYSGIVAMYAWGCRWDKVEVRHNGNGATLIQFNSTLVHMNSLVNEQSGIYLWDSVATVVGGVLQGNDVAHNALAGNVTANAEIVLIGGACTLDGVYFEGEGINPPWSIIVDGIDDTNRCYGAKILGCNMTRSTATDRSRGCIYVRYAEETVIEGNSIYPTSVDGVSASTVPHITLATNSLNTRIGHNAYRGRNATTGSFYSWLPPILNTSSLPQYEYQYAKSNGGIKTIQKRLRLDWLLPNTLLTANLGETYAFVPGSTKVCFHPLARQVWLTNIGAILPQGMSSGTYTVNVYNRENDAGSLVLIKTVTASLDNGFHWRLLDQHPYQTLLQPGYVLVTVSTSSSFAPIENNEILLSLEFEEFDNH